MKRIKNFIANDKLREAIGVMKNQKAFRYEEANVVQISAQLVRLENQKAFMELKDYNSNRTDITNSMMLLVKKVEAELKKSKSNFDQFREKYLYGLTVDAAIKTMEQNSDKKLNLKQIMEVPEIRSRKVLIQVMADLEDMGVVKTSKEDRGKCYQLTLKVDEIRLK